MKIIKTILLLLGGLIGLALIGAIFVDGNIKYEKSISINAPVEKVWENVNSISDLNKWSPWTGKDPSMKNTYSGTSGAIGDEHCWESKQKDVGRGCQKITNVQAPSLVETDLLFKDPYESEAQAYIKLSPETNGTKATWGFKSVMPYPWRISKLFMNMDDMLDKDYSEGLARLKKLSETP